MLWFPMITRAMLDLKQAKHIAASQGTVIPPQQSSSAWGIHYDVCAPACIKWNRTCSLVYSNTRVHCIANWQGWGQEQIVPILRVMCEHPTDTYQSRCVHAHLSAGYVRLVFKFI